MLKFYRQEARRILAGQKKLSTILITSLRRSRKPFKRIVLTAKRMGESPCWGGVSGGSRCGKAEDGSGKSVRITTPVATTLPRRSGQAKLGYLLFILFDGTSSLRWSSEAH
jgi:hypothetical protein